jgi:hypothetical protein
MATASPTPEVKVSDGTYSLGSTGPGGGFIFYVDKKGFKCGPKNTNTGSPTGSLCHYLEVAPSGWKSGKSGDLDPNLYWAVKSKFNADVVGIPDEFAEWPVVKVSSAGIGLGYRNSIAIVKQGNDVNTSAGASRAFRGGFKSDWYLPTMAEANELCKWARGVLSKSTSTMCEGGNLNSPIFGASSAGFHHSVYATSSENINPTMPKKYKYMNIWVLLIFTNIPQTFSLSPGGKANTSYTRPIRAF